MSKTQEQILPREIELLARLMDDQFSIGGFRFGLNFLIDLIPEIGDIITTVVALYIFILAQKYNLPGFVKFKMLVNIGMYFVIGLIPWVGDIFGAYWKPNRRNVELIKNHIKYIPLLSNNV